MCRRAGGFDYEQRGGPRIAEAIRATGSPIVVSVDYVAGDFMDSATIHVRVRDDATRDQIRAFACGFVLPAMDSGDPPRGLSVDFSDSHSTVATVEGFACLRPKGPSAPPGAG